MLVYLSKTWKNNKRKFLFLLALGITTFLYWPVWQKIPIENFTTRNIDQEITRLDLPLNEDIKEILNGIIYLPLNRHELCLENKNKFYLLHADSYIPGMSFSFQTYDIAAQNFGREKNLGAMSINLYYQNNQPDIFYRKVGEPRHCFLLKVAKLEDYASSTIEYTNIDLKVISEFYSKKQGILQILRPIVGAYFIDTNATSVYIIARWKFFIITLIALFVAFLGIAKYKCKISHNQSKTESNISIGQNMIEKQVSEKINT